MQVMVLFKPDAVKRRLAGRILKVMKGEGLRQVHRTVYFKPSRQFIQEVYKRQARNPHVRGHVRFVASGTCGLALVEGNHAFRELQRLKGNANPEKAGKRTVRGKFGRVNKEGIAENVLHTPDSQAELTRELKALKKLHLKAFSRLLS